ncbi:MAG TPA: HAD family hydrolase [Acidiferrobacteraceae bacterium]|nr:HAD family hydrolase [Acidiferrobacteraceae bacterium]
MLALFDLDNTLLEGDSDYAWGQFLARQGLVDGVAYERENQRYYDEYRAGTLDIRAFLEFSLAPLAHLDPALLQRMRREFVRDCVQPMIRPGAADLIADHRRRGHLPLIITATNSFVTRPIADLFGIETLLATEPEEINGRFSGKVAGIPCFRDGKVLRLEQWMAQQGCNWADSWFYTDSHNDLPLLQRVTHPVTVDPDPVLRHAAQQNGWPILSLRARLTHPEAKHAPGSNEDRDREPK